MTTAEAEMNFSTLKRIKMFLSTMSERKQNALDILSIKQEFVEDKLDFTY